MHKNTTFYAQIIRAIAILSFSGMVSASVSATSVTESMSPEFAEEFTKKLNSQPWPEMHKKLAFMDNPYGTVYKEIQSKLKEEAAPGERRRLMTKDESMLAAKKMRFDYCQGSVDFFIDFSHRAHSLTALKEKPEPKAQVMKGNGINYPFTDDQTNSAGYRPAQIALTQGWEYRGKGEQHAEDFLATCLAIPINLYYKEDKI